MQTSESTREWLLNQRADSIRLRTALKDVKPDALRQRAIQLLDRVVNNYVGVKAPRRRWQAAQPGHKHYELQLVEWNEHEEWRRRTIAERAEIRRFQQTRLRIGMFAPEIEGRNLQQQPIRLSQFQGKVVLLAVGVDSSEAALNASFAQVAAKFAGQSVQCVSVISGSGGGGYSVRAIVENSKITWPIIRDTAEDDIQARWCQQTFPEMYIIDQQGIIRDHEIGNSISPQHLESLIERTVQSAKKPNNAPAAP